MQSAINPSLYATQTHATLPRPTLQGDVIADVAIIGGGLCGISAALQLAARGVSTVVLEAKQVGFGASGRNGGQALQGYAGSMHAMAAAVGNEHGQTLWDLSREALAILKDNVARFSIDCDLASNGYLYAANHAGHFAALQAWRDEAASRYGYHDFTLLDREALNTHLASNAYVGGLFDPNEVHLNPLAYLLALAKAAERAGVEIYEQSAATGWQAEANGIRVTTNGGSVRCKQLLIATNADVASIAPDLARYFLPVESFIVATEPLSAGDAIALMPSRTAIADSNRVLNYFRLTADNRLLFGGRASGINSDRPTDTRQRMLQVFPQLSEIAIAQSWGGKVDVPLNKLPHFGRLSPQIYFAQGFCGHGLALTGLAGKLVAEAMTGKPQRFDLFTRIRHQPLPTQLPGFATTAVTIGMACYQFLDWMDARWHSE